MHLHFVDIVLDLFGKGEPSTIKNKNNLCAFYWLLNKLDKTFIDYADMAVMDFAEANKRWAVADNSLKINEAVASIFERRKAVLKSKEIVDFSKLRTTDRNGRKNEICDMISEDVKTVSDLYLFTLSFYKCSDRLVVALKKELKRQESATLAESKVLKRAVVKTISASSSTDLPMSVAAVG